jgi:glycosyltransferase involved in cell wall biosynthesis
VNISKPTICHVLLTLGTGGAEMIAARLARGLRDDFRFVFICLDAVEELGEQLCSEGFAVHAIGRRAGLDWRCAWRLARRLRAESADIVHAHQYSPFVYSAAARRFYRRLSLLFTEHGIGDHDRRRRKRLIFNRIALENKDHVTAVGEAVRQSLVDYEGFPAHRVETIYNGVDIDVYTPSAEDRSAVRATLGINPNEFVVIQVARMCPIKDHMTAIDAVDRLRSRRVAVRLLLVGDGPLAPVIRRTIKERRLNEWVSPLGLRHDIPRLLRAADAGLLTSLSEGIPLSLLESMATGLPVVSTAAGGVSEVVEHNRTGLLAPVGDSEALADALQRLRGDVVLRRQLSVSGRESVQKHFSQVQMCESYQRLYANQLQGMRYAQTRNALVFDS